MGICRGSFRRKAKTATDMQAYHQMQVLKGVISISTALVQYSSGLLYYTRCDGWGGQQTCMVRMSKRPKNSLREIVRSKMVLYMSADVPLYQGNMGKKSGCSSMPTRSDLVVSSAPRLIRCQVIQRMRMGYESAMLKSTSHSRSALAHQMPVFQQAVHHRASLSQPEECTLQGALCF